jgi:hypothetical protein
MRGVAELCGVAESTVSCKSHFTTLVVLHWLGAALLQGDLPSGLAGLTVAQQGVGDYLGLETKKP